MDQSLADPELETGVAVVDAARRVTAWSPSAARLTGRAIDDVVGGEVWLALPALQRRVAAETFEEVLHDGVARTLVVSGRASERGDSPLELEVSRVDDHLLCLIRAARPFVAVTCAAIPENLLESELFGHERGAFTGALGRRVGRIEAASGGTLFLDEIADMSLPLQAKILRVVQEREVERVGGSDPIPVDVRILSATNRDLREAIAQGKFRENLYFRLAVLTIRLPTLNARGDDLFLLVGHFACKFATQMGKRVTKISERAILLVPGDTIKIDHLPDEFRGELTTDPRPPLQAALTLAEVEARHIAMVLAQAGGQIGEAAEILGIHRNTLARKVRDYRL